MAAFKIGSTNSVFGSGVAFFDNASPAPNSLLVDQSGFLISTGFEAISVGSPSWTITVNGQAVTSATVAAVFLWNTASNSASTVTIGMEGELSGAYGIFTEHRTSVVNKGSIYASGDVNSAGIVLIDTADGDTKVDNSGTIWSSAYGIRYWGDVLGTHTITNKGTIQGALHAIFVQTGTISVEKVTNSGTIDGNIALDSGDDVLVNSGLMAGGDIFIGGIYPDKDTLTNSGAIATNIWFGNGADTLVNSGEIAGDISFSDGGDTIVNSGKLDKSLVFGVGAGTTLLNSGTIMAVVVGSSGADHVTNTGTILGLVQLVDGDDVYEGGAGIDAVRDGNGADKISLGGGNDTYDPVAFIAADGNDTIDGGTGSDLYDAGACLDPVHVNIDSVAHTYLGIAATTVAGSTAYGLTISGSATGATIDKVTGFEHVAGGTADDVIYGSAARNELGGLAGADILMGFAGNDRLLGNSGSDFIDGGLGADVLNGGSDIDSFVYESLKDSGLTKATRDTIEDFTPGQDLIDLHLIDANSTAANDQAFAWLGTNVNFNSTAGALRAYWTGIGQIVEGDVNGDNKADFSIYLSLAHSAVLSAGDFIR